MLRSVVSFWYSTSMTPALRSMRPLDAERMRSHIMGMPFSGSDTPSATSSEQYMATRSPPALISLRRASIAVVLPHCLCAWMTKYCSLRMSDTTSGSRSVAESM